MRATIRQKEEQESKGQAAAPQVVAPMPAVEMTLKAISCEVCGAGFVAAAAHEELLDGSPDLLESAFMSVCHYCFRCRRPACPACWDCVHGVCGACVEEAQLPFRAQAPMLNGVIFPPRPQLATEREESDSFFVCVQAGRFQMQRQEQSQVPEAGAEKTGMTPKMLNTFHTPRKSLGSYAHSTHLLEAMTRLEQADPAMDVCHSVRPSPDVRAKFSTVVYPVAAKAKQVEEEDAPEARLSSAQAMDRLEPVLIILFLCVLLLVVALVVTAEFSPQANALFAHWLHIDIRGDTGYWISIVQQLRW